MEVALRAVEMVIQLLVADRQETQRCLHDLSNWRVL